MNTYDQIYTINLIVLRYLIFIAKCVFTVRSTFFAIISVSSRPRPKRSCDLLPIYERFALLYKLCIMYVLVF